MHTRHPALGCLGTAILLAVLATAAPAAAATRHADTDYVALGDSYSSGVGVPGQVGLCEQSRNGYPGLWAARTAPKSFTNLACGGATTDGVRLLQIPLVSRRADLVSITVGGNDAGFAPIVFTCLIVGDSDCAATVAKAKADLSTTLPAKLDATYAAIRRKAPHARIVVLDYPLLFDTSAASCATVGLSVAKRRALNEGAQLLDETIKTRVRAAGLTFVEVRGTFAGHGICSPDPYLNGLTPSTLSDSFHPNQAGYRYGYLPAFTAAAG